MEDDLAMAKSNAYLKKQNVRFSLKRNKDLFDLVWFLCLMAYQPL